MLITSLYSLQVLDRVIGSGSKETLPMLSLIIGFIYFVYGLLQIARSFTLIKVGEWLDNTLSPVIFGHAISASATRANTGASQLLHDFQTVKTFLTSAGINTIFDAPWSIICIIVIFMIHPYIGIITIVGAIIIVSTAFFNAVVINKTLGEATEFAIKSHTQADVANRNAEAVEVMRMMKNVTKIGINLTQLLLLNNRLQVIAMELSPIFQDLFVILQMLVIGVRAYVVVTISGKVTTGGMIASSIIVGRAFAPFDNAIELWKMNQYQFLKLRGILLLKIFIILLHYHPMFLNLQLQNMF